jgi:hypothetical protein
MGLLFVFPYVNFLRQIKIEKGRLQSFRAAIGAKVPTRNELWMSMALVGALRRCPTLAVLALRRAGRLASHPARTTSIFTIYSWWVLNP